METLFQLAPSFPSGFLYIEDFIDEKEEELLVKSLKEIPLHPLIFQGYEAKRKVASFGYDYNFSNRTISAGPPVPAFCQSIIEKAGEFLSLAPEQFAEVLLTEYPPGSVINWHRDAPPFDIIVGISLLSDCTFKLRPHVEDNRRRASVLSFPVKRRSLYVMQGPSRTDWQHSISPVKTTRYSITLRTLR